MSRTYPEKVRDHARRELAREVRRLCRLRLKALAREIARARERMTITPRASERRILGLQAREIEVALMLRTLESAMRATRGR